MPSMAVGDARIRVWRMATAKPLPVNDLPTSIDWRDKVAHAADLSLFALFVSSSWC